MRALRFGIAAVACFCLSSAAVQAGGATAEGFGAVTSLADEPDADKAKDGKADPDRPASKFSTEVLVLHATNTGKGIDKRIGEMPQLQKPPFSSYDSYELLQKKTLPLVKGKPESVTLPNKRVLRTELLEVLPKDYVKLSASINQPGGEDFLPLLEVKAKAGQSFIVAGQSYKGGILVLVIRVIATPSSKK